ncbi:hypothetical protein ACLSU7_03290 [Bdellovibrio sp. HCB185ZH]|uniref:hypothetical protein n=1 Tax=Bdellovibrio sp. HCB185ZH TaxID=3394235 RepID=UPI0039A73198
MSKVLFLEINEVPFRLIDKYLKTGDYPNIQRFFNEAWQYESFAVDKGELHPWVTWPTVHRGTSAETHNVLHLGQDVKSFKGSAIWEDLRKEGKTVGVFGSMQSWPPKDPGVNGFYIPDTFAHDEQCIPAYVEPLQKMNLGQVRKNGRVVSKELPPLKEILQFMVSGFKCGISASTLFKLAAQLIGEKFDPVKRSRRPVFQTILFWDVFKSLYFNKVDQIDYASFFTNHVAGVMHRYWNHVFPEDFRTQNNGEQQATMRFALETLDNMLSDVYGLLINHPDLVVVFGTSMGQAAVYNDGHHGYELTVGDIEKLFVSLGFDRSTFTPQLSMVPLIGVEFKDEATVQEAIKALDKVTYKGGTKAFEVEKAGLSLCVKTLWPPVIDIKDGHLYRAGAAPLTFAESGIRVIETEAGTGYHVPEGIFAVYSHDLGSQPKSQFRKRINADKLKQVLLNLESVGPTETMAQLPLN